MGGEKRPGVKGALPPLGSPPHGRGKVLQPLPLRGAARITPAWAGKRLSFLGLSKGGEDHPRMGGEKTGTPWRWLMVTGSPPHGRGKAPVRPA